MFCRHKYGNTPKCAIKKAYLSKTKAKAHSYSTLGPEHQHGKGPGPPKSPPDEGSVGRRQLGCGRTLGAVTPPLPPLGLTLQEVVQLMPPRMVAWVLTKNTTPNHHTQAI
jgi:hypothetical protein